MKIPAEHILKDFVDRTIEVLAFQRLLGESAKRIMCVHGPGGIGKSVLMSRMMSECKERGISWVHVEWEDSRLYNYLDVMRKVRDGTNPELFKLFTDRVNFYTVPEYKLQIELKGGAIENVQVLPGGQITQSGVIVHIGHTIEIRDSMLKHRRPDRDVTENEVIIDLTATFMVCVKALTTERPLVIFLDAYEKVDELTHTWIWEELLTRSRDKEISNLLVVLSGRNQFKPDPTFFDMAEVYELQRFRKSDILEYLVRRGLEDGEHLENLAVFIYANSGNGNPLEIAVSVNNFIHTKKRMAN